MGRLPSTLLLRGVAVMQSLRGFVWVIAFAAGTLCVGDLASAEFQTLAPGFDYALFPIGDSDSGKDSLAHVIRVDPQVWETLVLALPESEDSRALTARDWCESRDLVFATNAGMYAEDHREHVGYFCVEDEVFTQYVHPRFQSVAALHPRTPNLPPFQIIDLDVPGNGWEIAKKQYATLIQNLRLIKKSRENRWPQQSKKWSEMALGEDDQGRMLFIFTRVGLSMHDWNRKILALPIGLVTAQHLEGGPEAQFYLNVGGEEVEQVGSFETGFWLSQTNRNAWPLPNVIGIASPK